jgi:hypothetical protein
MADALMDRHNATLFSAERFFENYILFWSMKHLLGKDSLIQTDRPLTSGELTEARLVFGPGLDYSAVRITEDPLLGAFDTARTIPSGVNFPVGASRDPGYMPWLIHELTHLWQYQHGRSVFATGTRAILCWIHVSSYAYGGRPALSAATAAGKGLSSFETEEQGEIARDYYVALTTGASVTEYLPFVAEFHRP